MAQERSSICLDAGHGGSDAGAVGWGRYEKNINMDVVNRLASLMRNAGWTVYLSRSDDSDVSLSSRTSYANNVGANRFISVHCNAFNQSAHGTETFCYTEGSNTSFSMRDHVNPQVVNALGTYNRGCKTANFYVVKYTNMPAILCELAFIDNQEDSAKLGDAYYRQRAAEAIKAGFMASFSREESDVSNSSEYMAASFSPDNGQILVTKPGYNGLYLISEKGAIKTLSDEARIGYKAYWISNREIVCQSSGERGKIVLTTEGEKLPFAENRNEIVVSVSENNILVNGEKLSLPQGNDVYFNPVLSPDKTLVCYEGLSTGLHVSDLAGKFHVALGAGNNPSWTPDSKNVVFDRALDDGHSVVESDLWIVSVERPADPINLTKNGKMVAQRPSISPDGSKIAFDAKGKIFVASFSGSFLKSCQEVSISK